MLTEAGYNKLSVSVDTFCKIVNNIISHPTEPKYRRIRLANPTFQEKLWSSIGGPELLQAVGFKVVDDGQYVEMGQGDLDLQTLKRAVEEVRQEFRTKALISVSLREFVTRGQAYVDSIQISGAQTALQLKNLVAERSGFNVQLMKLVHQGNVLEDDIPLASQLKCDSGEAKILITKWASLEDRQKALELQQRTSRLEMIVRAAEEMALRGYDEQYFELMDQHGTPMKLPEDQRQALMVGMALHGKGNAFWRQQDPHLALGCLVEADKRFRRCPEKLLQVMDNYGFIHLDIVWIYVLLADPSFLDHAALHLRLAEEFLRRSHGHGLEKLKQGVEQHVDVGVLYLRLHIAQAVLAHLTGKRGEAVLKIEQAMRELSQLKVKDDDVSKLMEMGYSCRESHRALRACQQSIAAAVEFINNQREMKERQRQKELQDRMDRQEAKRYGQTVNNNFIEMAVLRTLEEFGFSRELVVEALQQTDNNQGQSLELLMQSPEILETAILERRSKKEEEERQLKTLLELGYAEAEAQVALTSHGYNVQRAVEVLSQRQLQQAQAMMEASTSAPMDESASSGPSNEDYTENGSSPAVSSEPEPELSADEAMELDKMEQEHTEEEEKAKVDMTIAEELLGESWLQDGGEFMDSDLCLEETVVMQYQALIESGSQSCTLSL
jgi:Holliday junction resolvasome RuvABC DNA-binding subunit